jgi:hypothetical protein
MANINEIIKERKQKLKNAQTNTILISCAIFLYAFSIGANKATLDEKEPYIIMMLFAEMAVIFSLVSILINRKK